MKTLEHIFSDLKPGDCILYQEFDSNELYSKPRIAVIVGIDVWDMAMAVYYTDYKDFQCFGNDAIKIHGFGEWSVYWNVLGHWNTIPEFKILLSSYRNQQP